MQKTSVEEHRSEQSEKNREKNCRIDIDTVAYLVRHSTHGSDKVSRFSAEGYLINEEKCIDRNNADGNKRKGVVRDVIS